MPELKCPSCEQPLQLNGNAWLCTNGHRFDRARRGYTNLLLAQHRRSRSPGRRTAGYAWQERARRIAVA